MSRRQELPRFVFRNELDGANLITKDDDVDPE